MAHTYGTLSFPTIEARDTAALLDFLSSGGIYDDFEVLTFLATPFAWREELVAWCDSVGEATRLWERRADLRAQLSGAFDRLIGQAIAAGDWSELERMLDEHHAPEQRASSTLTPKQVRRIELYLNGVELTWAEVQPWVATAIALNQVWQAKHRFERQDAPVAPYHWGNWRMLTTAPDIIEASQGEVRVGWIVDDRPKSYRGARDIVWLTFSAMGYVTWEDTNIIWPGMADTLNRGFARHERARHERNSRWTGDFDD